MMPDDLYVELNRIRTGYRLRMNRAADKAQVAAAADDMASVSEHSSESERCREAFAAMNLAIEAVDEHFGAASAAPKVEPEYIYDDERFNKGVQHVVDMLARNLGVDDWVAGDGSEDYDEDLWQTILNILGAKRLYDSDTGSFATAPPAPDREAVARISDQDIRHLLSATDVGEGRRRFLALMGGR